MAYEHNPNWGTLFKREDAKGTQPIYTGDGKVICPHCRNNFIVRMAAWGKRTQRAIMLNLKFSDPDDFQARRESPDRPRDDRPSDRRVPRYDDERNPPDFDEIPY